MATTLASEQKKKPLYHTFASIYMCALLHFDIYNLMVVALTCAPKSICTCEMSACLDIIFVSAPRENMKRPESCARCNLWHICDSKNWGGIFSHKTDNVPETGAKKLYTMAAPALAHNTHSYAFG